MLIGLWLWVKDAIEEYRNLPGLKPGTHLRGR